MPVELIELGKIGGLPVLLLLFIGWWGMNRKWVFGWIYQQEQDRHREEIAKKDAEISKWQDMAIGLAGMADYASRQAVEAVDRRAHRPAPARRDRPAPGVAADAPK